MEEIKKCSYCGKEYILNENVPDFMEESFAKMFKYKPNCNCTKEILDKEWEEKERKMIKEQQDAIKKARTKKFESMSIIDNKFKESTFESSDLEESYMKLAKLYADKLIEKNGTNQGIIFYGNCGTGKTHASSCIANHLMINNKGVLVISLSSYLTKLRTEWSELEIKVIDLVKDCDLFIIDDLGTESKTEWVMEKIFTLIDTRYRSGKAMIITTNLKYDKDLNKCEIKKAFGERVRDRIEEMCFPKLVTSSSKRKSDPDKFAEFLK